MTSEIIGIYILIVIFSVVISVFIVAAIVELSTLCYCDKYEIRHRKDYGYFIIKYEFLNKKLYINNGSGRLRHTNFNECFPHNYCYFKTEQDAKQFLDDIIKKEKQEKQDTIEKSEKYILKNSKIIDRI